MAIGLKLAPGQLTVVGRDKNGNRSEETVHVTYDYPGELPWRFTGGTITRVAVDVSGEPYLDLEREAAAMLMRE